MAGQTLTEQIARLQEAYELAIIAMYSNTTIPLKEVLKHYDISYNKLYRILDKAGVPRRKPQAHEIVVLDKDNDNAPTWVERTPATLELRARQIQDAYYVRQEVVAHICATFHVTWRTLYRICPPNRRNFNVPRTPD